MSGCRPGDCDPETCIGKQGAFDDRRGREFGDVRTITASVGTRPGARSVGLRLARDRKDYPITTGVLDYFPDAIAELALVSFTGNEQHHPGEPVHWDKEKSTDEADALVRHLMDRGARDDDGLRHTAKVAWRAMALLQREIEAERETEAEYHS